MPNGLCLFVASVFHKDCNCSCGMLRAERVTVVAEHYPDSLKSEAQAGLIDA